MKRWFVFLLINITLAIISNAQKDTGLGSIPVSMKKQVEQITGGTPVVYSDVNSDIVQIDNPIIHKGILSATGTIAIGLMPENNLTNAYLTGDLEYYAENKISFRGDVYLFLNSLNENTALLNKNDALYFGAFYHFQTHSHFDPVIGFQPGISYTQALVGDPYGGYAGVYPDQATICPLASGVIGLNYFAEKWFHIEVNIRYTIGEHLTTADETNISELSFNFGLGFNFDVLKKKK